MHAAERNSGHFGRSKNRASMRFKAPGKSSTETPGANESNLYGAEVRVVVDHGSVQIHP
jgi:hypothetical protein